MTANPPEAAFILISSHEMEDAWRDLLLASLATVISWFETNFPIVSARFRCIGVGGAVVTGLLSAEVTLTATGRRSVLRVRADDGGRERHFCPISYNKVKKIGKL